MRCLVWKQSLIVFVNMLCKTNPTWVRFNNNHPHILFEHSHWHTMLYISLCILFTEIKHLQYNLQHDSPHSLSNLILCIFLGKVRLIMWFPTKLSLREIKFKHTSIQKCLPNWFCERMNILFTISIYFFIFTHYLHCYIYSLFLVFTLIGHRLSLALLVNHVIRKLIAVIVQIC